MPAKEGGIRARYNVQTVVDASSHMIADFHVTEPQRPRADLRERRNVPKNLGLES